MCPVAAKSKNSNPSSKKTITKKIDSNLETHREEEITKNQGSIQNLPQYSLEDNGGIENNDEFNGSDEEAKALGNIKSDQREYTQRIQ